MQIDVRQHAWTEFKSQRGTPADREYQMTLDVQAALTAISKPNQAFRYDMVNKTGKVAFPDNLWIPKTEVDAMLRGGFVNLNPNGKTGTISAIGLQVLDYLDQAYSPVTITRTPGRKFAEAFRLTA